MLAAFKDLAKGEGNRTGSRSTRGAKKIDIEQGKGQESLGMMGSLWFDPLLKGSDNGQEPFVQMERNQVRMVLRAEREARKWKVILLSNVG